MEAASRFKQSCEIVVSTNDERVIEIAEDFNVTHEVEIVKIVKRPENISGDKSSTEEYLIHAVDFMCSRGFSFDYISLLQPTSPARPDNLIDRCFKKITEYGAESLMTVSKHTPFFWKYEDGGSRSLFLGERKMRQDISRGEMYYHDNGNVYIIRADIFRENGRITSRPLLHECSEFESMQIDTVDHFALMEMAAKHYGGFL
jgi:CMP-N-acetylneuraminic acid synthetase